MIFVCIEPTAFKPIFHLWTLYSCERESPRLNLAPLSLSLSSPYEQQQQNNTGVEGCNVRNLTCPLHNKVRVASEEKCGCARGGYGCKRRSFFLI